MRFFTAAGTTMMSLSLMMCEVSDLGGEAAPLLAVALGDGDEVQTITVASGEVLSGIAALCEDVSVTQLVAWNDIEDPDYVRPGQQLLLPANISCDLSRRPVRFPSPETAWERCSIEFQEISFPTGLEVKICKQVSASTAICHDPELGHRQLLWNGQPAYNFGEQAVFFTTLSFLAAEYDLDNDGDLELIVQEFDGTSNGMAVDFWSLYVWENLEEQGEPDLRIDLADPDWVPFVTRESGCDLLVSSWEPLTDPYRGGGLYLTGSRYEYRDGTLTASPASPRVRRFLNGSARSPSTLEALNHIDAEVRPHPLRRELPILTGGVVTQVDCALLSEGVCRLSVSTENGELVTVSYPRAVPDDDWTTPYATRVWFGGESFPRGYLTPSIEWEWLGRTVRLRGHSPEHVDIEFLD
ncbi:MAG: LysM peptidoglycan-binding domain-containing protein [Myxococcales bacterium]|nr:LysM peptidoglycan-binding domain-containing protein [Myxococcales bacterium]